MDQKTTKTTGDLDALNAWEEALASPYEHMWVLFGEVDGDLWHARMIPMASGGPAQVSFDANEVIKREEEVGDVVGFLHTHPSFSSHYSSRDDRTMKAWCLCFGKPLVCCIKGVDGWSAWWYMDDETEPENYQVKRVKKILFGVTPALYEYNHSDPAEGLDFEDDPDAKPIEEFMSDDERADWMAYVKEIETNGLVREEDNGEQQIPS